MSKRLMVHSCAYSALAISSVISLFIGILIGSLFNIGSTYMTGSDVGFEKVSGNCDDGIDNDDDLRTDYEGSKGSFKSKYGYDFECGKSPAAFESGCDSGKSEKCGGRTPANLANRNAANRNVRNVFLGGLREFTTRNNAVRRPILSTCASDTWHGEGFVNNLGASVNSFLSGMTMDYIYTDGSDCYGQYGTYLFLGGTAQNVLVATPQGKPYSAITLADCQAATYAPASNFNQPTIQSIQPGQSTTMLLANQINFAGGVLCLKLNDSLFAKLTLSVPYCEMPCSNYDEAGNCLWYSSCTSESAAMIGVWT